MSNKQQSPGQSFLEALTEAALVAPVVSSLWPVIVPFLAVCCLLTGCLSRPALQKQSFAFSGPPMPTTAAAAHEHGRIAVLRRVTVAAPFDSQSLIYRTGEFSYERDSYAEFLVPPAEALSTPLCAYLAAANTFSAVVEPGSAVKPNTLIEISVTQLYGDFRKGIAPDAVLALGVVCFDAPGGAPGRILLQKDYSQRVRLRSRTAAGVVAGMNEALKQLMAQADSDLKHAVTSSQQSSP